MVARPADVDRPVTSLEVHTMGRMTGRTIPILALTALLMACGGTTGGGSTGGGSGTGSQPTGAGATDAPAASDAGATAQPAQPTDAPAASAGGTGGGTGSAADVCGLVTVAEIEGIFGVSGVTQQLFAGPPDTCDYRLDDAPFVAMVLTEVAASPVFDAMAADAASEPFDGIGDRALYNSQMLSFLVQRGDALVTLQVLDESRSEAERLELMKQIAAIAAGRM